MFLLPKTLNDLLVKKYLFLHLLCFAFHPQDSFVLLLRLLPSMFFSLSVFLNIFCHHFVIVLVVSAKERLSRSPTNKHYYHHHNKINTFQKARRPIPLDMVSLFNCFPLEEMSYLKMRKNSFFKIIFSVVCNTLWPKKVLFQSQNKMT